MREKLNENPMAQMGLVAVLLIAAVFLLMSMGGGSEEEGEEAAAPAAAESAIATAEVGPGAVPTLPAPGSGIGAAPPLPRPLVSAFEADRTVVLLFVRTGGIDDRLTQGALKTLSGMPGVSPFVVPADQIARYAAVAQGVRVNRVPALVVVRPRDLSGQVPTASVQYGFRGPQSIIQAVVDAGYKGPTLSYHP